MAKIILIGHKARSGKDTFATFLSDSLKEYGYSSEIIRFADPMKEILADTLGVSVSALELMKNESAVYRSMVQNFAMSMRKVFGDSVWADKAKLRANSSTCDYVIIPDFRFFIEDIEGSTTINVVREGSTCGSDLHVSETELDTFDYDYTASNNNGLDGLFFTAQMMAEIIISERKKHEKTI